MGVFSGGDDRLIGHSSSFWTVQNLHRGAMVSLSQYQPQKFIMTLLYMLPMYDELHKQVCRVWVPFYMLEMEKSRFSRIFLHSYLLYILVH